MLLLLREQDKMAPDLSHPEVKNNNIRSSSEAIPSLIQGTVAGAGKSGFRPASFLQLQDGFSKGRMQCHSSKRCLK
ncbi:uncharacterized protein LOC126952183 isoform X2 [Macaca thibetana thibetana]|uniref:uncharacterized protein LOC126952183 isoform X2 n=1 Tax=Macaca thibetana thibetana TaxID=257877 RepID=UPI0021BCAF4A|nr:uncharacterized protein LOC126952183 isoform X2 [Macaca thibetana thibetana]